MKQKIKKYIKNILLAIVVFTIIIICGLMMKEGVSFFLKKVLVYKVNANIDNLNQLINDVSSYESEANMVIRFEDTENIEYLRELFINLDCTVFLVHI